MSFHAEDLIELLPKKETCMNGVDVFGASTEARNMEWRGKL